MDRNYVIYSIKCKDYRAEAGKELRKRITEKKNAVRRRDPLSSFFQNSNSTSHEIDWKAG